MNLDEREKIFVERIRNELDATVENLTPETLLRLREARFNAVAGAEKRRAHWFAFPRWATAGGLASLAVMVVAVSIWVSASRQTLPARQPEDVEILTSHEHLDMYKDLEFYRWLADVDNEK
jgi:anti-sigma-K factor RskA